MRTFIDKSSIIYLVFSKFQVQKITYHKFVFLITKVVRFLFWGQGKNSVCEI